MVSSTRCAVAVLLLVLNVYSSTAGPPRIVDDPNRNYTLYNEDGSVCLYASFDMNFVIIYESDNLTKSADFRLPPSSEMSSVSGVCNSSLNLKWSIPNGSNLGLTLDFSSDKDSWTIKQVAISFVLPNSSITSPTVYATNSTNLLNRTYNLNQYFYCERCKTFYLTESVGEDDALSEPCETNTSRCSTVEMMKAVIYPGNIGNGVNKHICIEDYIALQEIIVPVVVGGILAILLVVIFVSYVITYIRRRRKESRQYEPVTGDM